MLQVFVTIKDMEPLIIIIPSVDFRITCIFCYNVAYIVKKNLFQ